MEQPDGEKPPILHGFSLGGKQTVATYGLFMDLSLKYSGFWAMLMLWCWGCRFCPSCSSLWHSWATDHGEVRGTPCHKASIWTVAQCRTPQRITGWISPKTWLSWTVSILRCFCWLFDYITSYLKKEQFLPVSVEWFLWLGAATLYIGNQITALSSKVGPTLAIVISSQILKTLNDLDPFFVMLHVWNIYLHLP